MTLRACLVTLRARWGDAKSSLGDAKSSLGGVYGQTLSGTAFLGYDLGPLRSEAIHHIQFEQYSVASGNGVSAVEVQGSADNVTWTTVCAVYQPSGHDLVRLSQ